MSETQLFPGITLGNVITALTFIVSGISAVIAVTWKISRWLDAQEERFSKAILDVEMRLQKHIESHIEDDAQKHGRFYARLDEVKKDADDRFVRKDMQEFMNTQMSKSIEKLEAKIDSLTNKLEKYFQIKSEHP